MHAFAGSAYDVTFIAEDAVYIAYTWCGYIDSIHF